MYEQFTGDFTFRDSATRQVQLGIYKRREFYERPACSIRYFSTYSDSKSLFLILNICYEHTTLVSVLQRSYVNV